MTECFDIVVDFYRTILPDVLENAEGRENIAIAQQVSRESVDYFETFFNIVVGKEAHPFMSAMNFPQRFLNRTTLEATDSAVLEAAVERLFYLGFVYHFVFMRFPTRQNIDAVDFEELSESWLPETSVADVQFRDRIFDAYYKSSGTESQITTQFRIGFLKRGLVRSFLRNIYYSGMLYAMKYDLATGGVSPDSVRMD